MINQQQARRAISPKNILYWLTLALVLICVQARAQTGGTVTYVYTDPQGTPLAETDANGNITATFEYTPYGTYAPQGTSTPGPAPKGPGYTGHVNDPETNLVYMQARYYDPATGHFLSVDPVAPSSGNLSNFNRFNYAANNPVVNIDPDGRQNEDGRVESDFIENIQNARTLRPMPPPAETPSLPPAIDPFVVRETTLTQSPGEAMSNLEKAADKIIEASQARQEREQEQNRSTTTPRTSSRTLRSRWEKQTGQKWPKDTNGRNHDVSHIVPLADGGTNDVDNIEPVPHEEHMREHKENGDFQRWGSRSRPAPPPPPQLRDPSVLPPGSK